MCKRLPDHVAPYVLCRESPDNVAPYVLWSLLLGLWLRRESAGQMAPYVKYRGVVKVGLVRWLLVYFSLKWCLRVSRAIIGSRLLKAKEGRGGSLFTRC